MDMKDFVNDIKHAFNDETLIQQDIYPACELFYKMEIVDSNLVLISFNPCGMHLYPDCMAALKRLRNYITQQYAEFVDDCNIMFTAIDSCGEVSPGDTAFVLMRFRYRDLAMILRNECQERIDDLGVNTDNLLTLEEVEEFLNGKR
jgi:hypothetical protein